MRPIQWLLAGACGAAMLPLGAQEKDAHAGIHGEVRMPLEVWQQKLLAGDNAKPAEAPAPAPTLGSVKYKVGERDGRLVLEVPFRVMRFAAGWSQVPLLAGDFTLEAAEPASTRLVTNNGWIGHVDQAAGEASGAARFVVSTGDEVVRLETAVCPAAFLEVGGLAQGHGLEVTIDGRERVLAAGTSLPLPGSGVKVGLKLLHGEEASEALRPPQPSVWSWQHQVLVLPGESEIEYHLLAHASTNEGSGLEAVLRLPAEARQVMADGEDLADSQLRRAADGTPQLQLRWNSRGVLERDVVVSYAVPQRPLDKLWTLAAPLPDQGKANVRYLVAQSDARTYSAEKLEGPLVAESCPRALRDKLRGISYYAAERDGALMLSVRDLPRMAIADAVVEEAVWSSRVESDGSQLLEGQWKISHSTPLRLPLNVPEGLQLLRCTVNGKALEPIAKGNGALEIPLGPRHGEMTLFACSFTARGQALDAVEGTLALALPQTPLFIKTVGWQVKLPEIYQADAFGTLNREPRAGSESPFLLRLRKELCRDDKLGVNVFYQRRNQSL